MRPSTRRQASSDHPAAPQPIRIPARWIQAKYLSVWVRNQNPRLRTLPLARDLRLDLRGGDCEAPLNHQLAKLATDARMMSGSTHTYYFTLTVAGGAVHQVQEILAINAC